MKSKATLSIRFLSVVNNSLSLLIVLLVGLILSTSRASAQQVSAPILTAPLNEDTLQLLYPVFSWTPSVSTDLSQQMRYKIKIVEIFAGQSAEGALLSNPSWFEQDNIITTMFSYPLTAPVLKKDIPYAWQVQTEFSYKINSGERTFEQIAQVASEASSIIIHDQMSDESCVPILFAQLDERFYVFGQKVHFQLPEEIALQTASLIYQIIDNQGIVIINPLEVTKEGKLNQYSFLLSDYAPFRKKANKGKFFILEATLKGVSTYKVKFTYK